MAGMTPGILNQLMSDSLVSVRRWNPGLGP
jgi:hypothetical protein